MPDNFYGGGSSYGSLGQIRSPTLLPAASPLRALRVRLTASTWEQTQHPYLVLEVPEDELSAWAPGFEAAMDGIVEIVPNPFATVERYDDMIVLLLNGEGLWTPAPFADWPYDGDCDVIVVARGRLPPETDADRELALADLINSGQAYFSMLTIEARDSWELPGPER